MIRAAIFDMDGTLVDSVDLHALAWQEAFAAFGHRVSFAQARGQIGKGGDKLIPVFLSSSEAEDHGEALKAWREKRFKSEYLGQIRPFSSVPDLFRRARDHGIKTAVASSAKKAELEMYLKIAGIEELVDIAVSSEDAEESKPAPDIFQAALQRLDLPAGDAIAIGDAPYDAQAAGKTGIQTIGFLSGGFNETDLRDAGCIAIYPGPGSLLACFDSSPLAQG